MAEDLSFTFDTDVFTRGIAQVTKGMDSMRTSATTVARGISKGFNAVIVKLGVLKGAFSAIKDTLNQMPEIGQAFGIARNVFLKNLLFPLRKEIMPLLQRMMDWVRDNRTLFVKWGQTLANIFRSAVSGLKSLFNTAKEISGTIFKFVSGMFGDTVKTFDDLLNILSFKIATAIQFLAVLVEPIRRVVEPIIKLLAEVVESFTGGFLDGIAGIEEPLKRIFEAMSGIVETLFTGEGPLEFWKKTFDTLGVIIGTTLKVAIEAVALIIEGIEISIKNIKDFFDSETFKEFKSSLTKEGIKEELSAGAFMGTFKRIFNIDDGIVTSDGKIIRTDPGDTIIATKNPVTTNVTNSNSNPTITIENTINITGVTDENAESLTTRMLEALRGQYEQEFTRSGL